MSGNRQRLVGFYVRKIGPPDKNPTIGINKLVLNCRECRVFTTEEGAGEIEARFLGFSP